MKNGVISRRLQGVRWQDVPFFLSYGVFLATSVLSTSFYYRYFMGYPYTWIQSACVALLLIYEFRKGLQGQNWLGLGICGIMALISLQVSTGNLIRLVPLLFMYTYCARNLHFERVARFSMNLSIVLTCFVVASGYLGIIDNVVVAKGSRVREYLGFRYALYAPGLLLNITALWIYLNRKKPSILGTVILAAVNAWVYYKTDSRISFALAILLLVAAQIMRFAPKWVEKLQGLWALAAASFGICGSVSMVMTGIYNGSIPWMRKLNSMLESRLSLGKRSLESKGVSLFARQISWVGNGLDAFGNSTNKAYTYVDCLYVKVMQRYGILFIAALLGVATWAMYRLWKQKHYHILLISATVAVHCILDDLSFSLHYNTFWIAMGLALLNPAALAVPQTEEET
ncbi:MAG: hypothetical protein IJ351_04050 [Oscillospiraceae bacterium]|nr:hypothetical protein [Oscillospiraceae bacterium]